MKKEQSLAQECRDNAPIRYRCDDGTVTRPFFCQLLLGHKGKHRFAEGHCTLTWPNHDRDLLAGDPPTLEPSRLGR